MGEKGRILAKKAGRAKEGKDHKQRPPRKERDKVYELEAHNL